MVGAQQGYYYSVSEVPPGIPEDGGIGGAYSRTVSYLLPTEQIVILGETGMKIRLGGEIYTASNGVAIIDGPFADPCGTLELSGFHGTDGWTDLQAGPFIVPDDVNKWGGILDGLGSYYDGVGKVRGLHHGFITGASKSFGFGAPVDKITYCPSYVFDAVSPDLMAALSKDKELFLPELFSQQTAGFGGELGIYARISDTEGNTFTTPDSSFYNHYVNALQRENTQNFVIGQSSVSRIKYSSHISHMRSVPTPIGFKVERKTAPTYSHLDHYEINFNGTTLTNFMLPSSVLMPDSTWRLMAYNRSERRYDIFSTTVGSKAGGFMTTVWGIDYHAAHMTRLIDGTLCAMAWTYSGEEKKYFLWFKRSADDGMTWGDPLQVASFSSTTPSGKTFNPTWVIVQNYRTGTIVIGDYFSDDMGNSWNLTT